MNLEDYVHIEDGMVTITESHYRKLMICYSAYQKKKDDSRLAAKIAYDLNKYIRLTSKVNRTDKEIDWLLDYEKQ